MGGKSSIVALLALGFYCGLMLQTRADCNLPKECIENPGLVCLDLTGGSLQIMWRRTMPSGGTMRIVCNETTIEDLGCTGNMWNTMVPPLKCVRPKNYVQETGVVATTAGPKEYSVFFKASDKVVELYRSVYSQQQLRPLYTVYHGYTGDVYANRPEVSFTTDRLMTGREAECFKPERVHARFQELLGPRQTFVTSPTEIVLHRGHLAPSTDFAFDYAMRATFKYLNAVPQFGPINLGNWAAIERWARKPLESRPYTVVTGALGVLQLRHSVNRSRMVDMFLLPNNRVPIPRWMFKVVSKEGVCTAFVTHNTIYTEGVDVPPAICQPVPCPLELSTEVRKGITYCCPAQQFLSDHQLQGLMVC